MYRLNLIAVWVGILAGFITGAVQGVFFTRPNWLGGYGSWERRMLRLGHIALVALGLINIAFWGTAESLHFGDVRFISLLFFAGHGASQNRIADSRAIVSEIGDTPLHLASPDSGRYKP